MSLRFVLLGEYLKDKRIEKGLTQKEVADELGFTVSQYVANWERGVVSPPRKSYKKLTKILGLNVSDFYQKLVETREQEVRRALFGLRK